MMDEMIGEIAGEVWDFLEEEGEASVSAIVNAVGAPRSKACMAIGWLAREDKLSFDDGGRGSTVSLG
ncbi:MAG: winged helix-turn-helix domain-containing protein [Candidatus Nanohaloarchaea archaeon]